MANLLDASGQSKFHRAKSKFGWSTSRGPAGQSAATCDGLHHSIPASRASMERMVGSGSEPTYLPLTNTSFAGLLLYCLGPANALEATLITRAIASAVLVNMSESPAGWLVTPHPVWAHLEPAR